MRGQVTQLRLEIDEPGEFLDWLIANGYSLRGAALTVADCTSDETQRIYRRFQLAEVVSA